MYLLLLQLFLATGFKQPFISNRIFNNRVIRYNYNGNDNDKLRKIDEALNNEKLKMKQLLTEKNKIMQNITGLNLHNETFIDDYLDSVVNENIYDSFEEDGFNNEYDYEFKPRPNKINIIINTNPQSTQKPKETDNVQSENFQLITNSTYTFNNIGGMS